MELYILFFYSFSMIVLAMANSTEDSNNNNNNNLTTLSNGPNGNLISLTYGSLLDVTCLTNDDCILKNSICNIVTRRCECDYNAIQDENRCHTLKCMTNQDCQMHFENTICLFGSCRCKLGLKANGKCVDIDIPGISGSQSMPDWAISLIAVAALLSGIWSGRSPFMSQVVRQLLSVLILILGQITRTNRFRGQRPGQQGQQQDQQQQGFLPIIDNIQLQNDLIQAAMQQQTKENKTQNVQENKDSGTQSTSQIEDTTKKSSKITERLTSIIQKK